MPIVGMLNERLRHWRGFFTFREVNLFLNRL